MERQVSSPFIVHVPLHLSTGHHVFSKIPIPTNPIQEAYVLPLPHHHSVMLPLSTESYILGLPLQTSITLLLPPIYVHITFCLKPAPETYGDLLNIVIYL